MLPASGPCLSKSVGLYSRGMQTSEGVEVFMIRHADAEPNGTLTRTGGTVVHSGKGSARKMCPQSKIVDRSSGGVNEVGTSFAAAAKAGRRATIARRSGSTLTS